MDVRPIRFQFKGARTYIHGTDIFNGMLAFSPTLEARDIRFSVHDFIRTPMCRLYSTGLVEELGGVEDVRARCQFSVLGAKHYLVVTAGEGDAISGERYAYDEGKVTSLCRMQGEGIVLAQESPYSFIENAVAMNKYLHQRLFQNVSGKWIFVRIDMDAYCDRRSDIMIIVRHNMNFRLTKSDILVEGKKVGDLYFSLVQP